MIARLREIGFGITVEPTGAFYVFANARRFTDDSYSFAFEVLEKAKVGITPGVDFGSNAEGYVRFSYANSLENIRKGLIDQRNGESLDLKGVGYNGGRIEYVSESCPHSARAVSERMNAREWRSPAVQT